jgi:hypothetical protein
MIPVLYGCVAAALIWMFWYYGNEIFYKINKNKFPPQIPYIIWAQFSLVTLFVLYNRLKITKENFITYIGKNAIFFYFAQGISSSLVYFLVVPLKKYALVAFNGYHLRHQYRFGLYNFSRTEKGRHSRLEYSGVFKKTNR